MPAYYQFHSAPAIDGALSVPDVNERQTPTVQGQRFTYSNNALLLPFHEQQHPLPRPPTMQFTVQRLAKTTQVVINAPHPIDTARMQATFFGRQISYG